MLDKIWLETKIKHVRMLRVVGLLKKTYGCYK